LKFFYSPGSCALATHITLAEVSAEYEAIRVDFGSAEQRGDTYMAINPKGRVPALVTDAGTVGPMKTRPLPT
jgi:glutathione S-transferase